MATQSLPVTGMHCASCALIIEKTLKKLPGVLSAEVNYGTEKVAVDFDSQKTSFKTLQEAITPLGYGISLPSDEDTSSVGASLSALDRSANAKELKLKDLEHHRNKVEFVMPITMFLFFAMLWDALSQAVPGFPKLFIPMDLFNMISFILATITMFWIGKPFLEGVVRFVQYRVANMDTLIGIGTLAAYLFSSTLLLFPRATNLIGLPQVMYFDVTIVVIGFITLGKYLEASSKLRTGEAIEALLHLQAKTALILRDGQEIEIPIEQVQHGDIIIVKPGAKIPVDGEIIDGKSAIDESMITGESMPVSKGPGSSVIGATINKQGSFTFRATKVGTETMLAQIIKMVEDAQGSRAPIQKLADKISGIFVPIVLAIAGLTLITWLVVGSQFLPFTQALSLGLLSFISILVIACPCALGLATPTAIIVGVGKGASIGILIKNAESLEKQHKVTTIVFDKTGTITKGEPSVTDIIPFNNTPIPVILSILGSLEKRSEHPLATAIMQRVTEEITTPIVEAQNFAVIEGKGVFGTVFLPGGIVDTYFACNSRMLQDLGLYIPEDQLRLLTLKGKTPVFLTSRSEVLALIGIADTLKDSAIETIKALHKLKIKTVMLTGDNQQTAQSIAKEVGIDQVIAEVLPAEKAAAIKALQAQGDVVAMAGDGINDAPALAQADVGIAMGSGTDVAIEAADITLLNGDISKLPQSFKLAKRTMRTIKQNLFWAFFYNIIGIPLAAGVFYPFFGILLNPIFAGAAMALSSVSVVTNSLRLKGMRL